MKAEYSATIFHVANVETSLKYYTEILGFTIDFRYNDLAGVVYGPVLIYLSGPGQDNRRAVGEGSIYVFGDEIDRYYQDIIARGALITVTIDNREYGMRDFGIRDPDGNNLAFGMESD